jgi:alginate O-acetyltransferase complex protein AlgI
MLFNSGIFLQFFAAFLLLYWLARNSLTARNLLIVAASYLFYGCWNWKFLGLLFFSSTFDWVVGYGIALLQTSRGRKALLAGSIVVNLVILGFFKYFNFFVESLTVLLAKLGVPFHTGTLSVILPVGISFYTFQSMSYAFDVYRGHIRPTRNFVSFLAFVSFFPHMVAGPIQRVSNLLPQFERPLVITRTMLTEGIWLIIWGMFKKVALADNFAPLVEMVFHDAPPGGLAVALGTVAFGLQIYCDFSGYSDIARGLARVLGVDIMWNFDLPYAATSLREFWRRWHISLSTWLRDYLYISLGGNRRGPARACLNVFLTMLLGGLWHGAAWNFVLWGAWHGTGLVAERVFNVSQPASDTKRPLRRFAGWLATMLIVFYGWLLFRAGSWHQVAAMTQALANLYTPPWLGSFLLNLAVFATPLMAMELWQFRAKNRLAPLSLPGWARALLQGALLVGILVFWTREKAAFIYFQF